MAALKLQQVNALKVGLDTYYPDARGCYSIPESTIHEIVRLVREADRIKLGMPPDNCQAMVAALGSAPGRVVGENTFQYGARVLDHVVSVAGDGRLVTLLDAVRSREFIK